MFKHDISFNQTFMFKHISKLSGNNPEILGFVCNFYMEIKPVLCAELISSLDLSWPPHFNLVKHIIYSWFWPPSKDNLPNI